MERPVEEAVAGVVDVGEDQREGGAGDDDRGEQDSTEDPPAADPLCEDHSDGDADRYLDEDADCGVERGVGEGFPEDRVVDQPSVVGGAGEVETEHAPLRE